MASMGAADRVVLITGATGPLGRAAAAAFAADGARLGLVGTDAGRLDALAADLALAEHGWVPAVADLTEQAAARDAVAIVEARFGRIDVLLHLVGGWTGGTTLVDLDPDVLAGMLGQHVWSTFHVAQAVVPGMVERGWGRIIAVTSSFTTAPTAGSAAYLAAKAGEETLLRTLARELGGDGVTVNVLAVRTIDAAHERAKAPSAKNAAWTTPEEMVATLRFLCSDDASAVNGQRLGLDGRG
jgi:NAD(P)-dependent dehydrogenase (short-subunit alcohol dehydrogenase family)